MTDIHSHILPSCDDGAAGITEAVNMLRFAENDGVTDIAATPHFNPEYGWLNYDTPELRERYDRLCEASADAGLRINIHRGMEIRASDETLSLLKSGKLRAYNDTRYILLEFDNWETETWSRRIVSSLIDGGYIPVIAHPERYEFISEMPWLVYDWLDEGCGIQLTRASIMGKFGRTAKQLSDMFLDKGWVSCIASDAHSPDVRTPELSGGYRYVSENYSPMLADLLFCENPKRILEGRELRED